MASVEKKVERSDSLPARIVRGFFRALLPVVGVSLIVYCVVCYNAASGAAEVDPSKIQASTFYQDCGDGFLWVGMEDARLSIGKVSDSGSYVVRDGTITLTGTSRVYSFRILTQWRVLSLDYNQIFSKKGLEND